MFQRRLLTLCLFLGVLSLTGCASRSKSMLSPGTDLSTIKTVYVVKQPKDNKDIDDLIKTNLEKRGFKVIKGPQLSSPYPADAAVTYVDRWYWDLTMYLIELTINLRDPQSGFPLAMGNAMHTSLNRKSPELMVDEVVTNMLTAPKQ
ncbi:hypothetical protein [Massilia sp. TWP1-3-3]|uniref:hypothetical protein n=1 Tax=Massilia sp. TWP1-3-3 TaxID=2804573 RepID=UPI003CE7C5D6